MAQYPLTLAGAHALAVTEKFAFPATLKASPVLEDSSTTLTQSQFTRNDPIVSAVWATLGNATLPTAVTYPFFVEHWRNDP